MDVQVENAVRIAWTPQSDPTLKSQAFEFLTQVRSDPQSWSFCIELFVRSSSDEVVRLFCLDIICNAIQSNHVDDTGLMVLRDAFSEYGMGIYRQRGCAPAPDSPSLQNKLAQTLTCLFAVCYLRQWESFFEDMRLYLNIDQSPSGPNPAGMRLYLKILLSVHDEIGDVLLGRSALETSRNTDLKDRLRERDLRTIGTSLQSCLQQYEDSDDGILEMCLSVIGRWASWADLSLLLNDYVLLLLFRLVSAVSPSRDSTVVKLRNAALTTITEILAKKMQPPEKLQLIDVLKITDLVSQLTQSPPIQQMRSTPEYDTDLAELIAKLINGVVEDLIVMLEEDTADANVSARANTNLKLLLPFLLRFLSDEYDEVCSTVIPALTNMLALFRRKGANDRAYQALLPSVLSAIVTKMRYDETAEWGSDDTQTDEAEFQDLRKRLQVLQQAVAMVDQALFVDTISSLVSSAFDTFQSTAGRMDWRDLDLALHEMFLLGHIATKNGSLYSKSKPISSPAERLIAMLYSLVELDIASFPHPAIQLQYMEISVRYIGFFEANPQAIRPALTHFVRFIHSDHVKVRSRAWYLFQRFLKQLRSHLGDIAETVLQATSDLLPIVVETPKTAADGDGNSSDDESPSDTRFTNQLYLYEAMGIACSPTAVPAPTQVLLMRTVMEPIYTGLQQKLGPASQGDETALLYAHHYIMALGSLAQGFSDGFPNRLVPASKVTPNASASHPADEVSDLYGGASTAILTALESLKSSFEIRTACRSAFSRMIGLVGNRAVPLLPRWVSGLLPEEASREETAQLLRLLDQIIFGFNTEIRPILESSLAPLLQRVFTGIAQPSNGTDDQIQLAELKAQYMAFIMVVLNNDLGDVMLSPKNQPTFEQAVSSLEHFAKDTTDLSNAKLAYTVLAKMVAIWGGPDVASPATNGQTVSSAQPQLPGFDTFVMQRFSPLPWMLRQAAGFNGRDAQTVQVLSESATLIRTIYMKTGPAYLEYLRTSELRSLGWTYDMISAYVHQLTTTDLKKFRQFVAALPSDRR